MANTHVFSPRGEKANTVRHVILISAFLAPITVHNIDDSQYRRFTMMTVHNDGRFVSTMAGCHLAPPVRTTQGRGQTRTGRVRGISRLPGQLALLPIALRPIAPRPIAPRPTPDKSAPRKSAANTRLLYQCPLMRYKYNHNLAVR